MSKKIKITQIGSPIGSNKVNKKHLLGLGLNKLHKTVELENNLCNLGMIKKVAHLLKIEYI